MTDPTFDKIAAAQADARNMMKTTLGSDGPTSGTSPIIERYPAPTTPRVQPQ